MDLAPYINDARSLTLPLLGGNTGRTSPYGFHDWEFILRETKLLRYDHTLANLAVALGTLMMICAFVWGGYILFKQHKNLTTSPKISLDNQIRLRYLVIFDLRYKYQGLIKITPKELDYGSFY